PVLDLSIEEQQSRTREIIDGIDTLGKNINPATGRPFKAKEREKFVNALENTREAYEALYAEVYSSMGKHIEAELRSRVEAGVGPLPERADAQSVTNSPEEAIEVFEDISAEQPELF